MYNKICLYSNGDKACGMWMCSISISGAAVGSVQAAIYGILNGF